MSASIFGSLGDWFNAGIWDESNQSFLNNSGFIGVIFNVLVDGNITSISFAKTTGDDQTTHNVYLLKKNGTGITVLNTTASSGETAAPATQTVALSAPVAVTTADTLMACYFKESASIPWFGLVADGQADFFFAIHPDFTNDTSQLHTTGFPDGVNGALYDTATEALPTNWTDFISDIHFSNLGVDVLFGVPSGSSPTPIYYSLMMGGTS